MRVDAAVNFVHFYDNMETVEMCRTSWYYFTEVLAQGLSGWVARMESWEIEGRGSGLQ